MSRPALDRPSCALTIEVQRQEDQVHRRSVIALVALMSLAVLVGLFIVMPLDTFAITVVPLGLATALLVAVTAVIWVGGHTSRHRRDRRSVGDAFTAASDRLDHWLSGCCVVTLAALATMLLATVSVLGT